MRKAANAAGLEYRLSPFRAQRALSGPLELKIPTDTAPVAIVNAAVAVVFALSAREDGEIVHRAPGGSAPHENVTVWLKPFCDVNINENVAASPGAMVRLPGEPLRENPWLAPGGPTVTVVEPQTVPAHAVNIAVPGAIPKTAPLFVESFVIPLLLPESFVTVATVESEELQTTEDSCSVLSSLKVPIATSD